MSIFRLSSLIRFIILLDKLSIAYENPLPLQLPSSVLEAEKRANQELPPEYEFLIAKDQIEAVILGNRLKNCLFSTYTLLSEGCLIYAVLFRKRKNKKSPILAFSFKNPARIQAKDCMNIAIECESYGNKPLGDLPKEIREIGIQATYSFINNLCSILNQNRGR